MPGATPGGSITKAYIQQQLAHRHAHPPAVKRWTQTQEAVDWRSTVPAVATVFGDLYGDDDGSGAPAATVGGARAAAPGASSGHTYVPLAYTLTEPPAPSPYAPPDYFVDDIEHATRLRVARTRELDAARRENRPVAMPQMGNMIVETPRFRKILVSAPARAHHGVSARHAVARATTRVLPHAPPPPNCETAVALAKERKAKGAAGASPSRPATAGPSSSATAAPSSGLVSPRSARTAAALAGATLSAADAQKLRAQLGGMKTKAGWEEARTFDSLIHDYRARTYGDAAAPVRPPTATTRRLTSRDDEKHVRDAEAAEQAFWLSPADPDASAPAGASPATTTAVAAAGSSPQQPSTAGNVLLVATAPAGLGVADGSASARTTTATTQSFAPPPAVRGFNHPHTPGRSLVRLYASAAAAASHAAHAKLAAASVAAERAGGVVAAAAEVAAAEASGIHTPATRAARALRTHALSPSAPPSLRTIASLLDGAGGVNADTPRPPTAPPADGGPRLSLQHMRYHRFNATGGSSIGGVESNFSSTARSSSAFGITPSRSARGSSSARRAQSARTSRAASALEYDTTTPRSVTSARSVAGDGHSSANTPRAAAAAAAAKGPRILSHDRPHRVPPPAFMQLPPRLEWPLPAPALPPANNDGTPHAPPPAVGGGASASDLHTRSHIHRAARAAMTRITAQVNASVANASVDAHTSSGAAVDASEVVAARRASRRTGLRHLTDSTGQSPLQRIADLKQRISACARAGRPRAEANAWFALGVMYDNLQLYTNAVSCYTAFRARLSPTQDIAAECLALNAIGVSYQHLGLAYASHALTAHAQHRDLSDHAGQFVACTNLGLVHISLCRAVALAMSSSANRGTDDELLEYARAARQHHEQALQCAVTIGSKAAQNTALANLGYAADLCREYDVARACLERHIALSAELGLTNAEAAARHKLGEIAAATGDVDAAAQHFEEIVNAHPPGQGGAAVSRAKAALGVTLAHARLDDHLTAVATQLRVESASAAASPTHGKADVPALALQHVAGHTGGAWATSPPATSSAREPLSVEERQMQRNTRRAQVAAELAASVAAVKRREALHYGADGIHHRRSGSAGAAHRRRKPPAATAAAAASPHRQPMQPPGVRRGSGGPPSGESEEVKRAETPGATDATVGAVAVATTPDDSGVIAVTIDPALQPAGDMDGADADADGELWDQGDDDDVDADEELPPELTDEQKAALAEVATAEAAASAAAAAAERAFDSDEDAELDAQIARDQRAEWAIDQRYAEAERSARRAELKANDERRAHTTKLKEERWAQWQRNEEERIKREQNERKKLLARSTTAGSAGVTSAAVAAALASAQVAAPAESAAATTSVGRKRFVMPVPDTNSSDVPRPAPLYRPSK